MNTVKRFLMLAAVLSVALHATTITQGCGSAGTGAQNQPGPPFPPFTPTISTSLGCPSFAIPVGQTLTDVQLLFKNDWQLGSPGTDTLVYTYALSGWNIPSMISVVTGTGLGGSTAPVGALPVSCLVVGDMVNCDYPILASGTFNAVGIGVTASWAMGGLDFSGSEGTTITETLTYSPLDKSGTPEPSALVMAGSGIIGLALVLRRHQKRRVE